MSKIRSKGTKAENLVFRELRKNKIYFQRHYKRAPGNPDIALPSRKRAIFIDGDFWHGHQFLKLKQRLPAEYWLPKIEGNMRRDKKNREELMKRGWKVLRVWEHEVNEDLDGTVSKVISFLKLGN